MCDVTRGLAKTRRCKDQGSYILWSPSYANLLFYVRQPPQSFNTTFSIMASLSPLLGLPRELRDAIYESIILDEQPLSIKSRPRGPQSSVLKSQATIILASKQLHNEYFEIFEEKVLPAKSQAVVHALVDHLDFTNLDDFTALFPIRELEAGNLRSRLRVRVIFNPGLSTQVACADRLAKRNDRFDETTMSASDELYLACAGDVAVWVLLAPWLRCAARYRLLVRSGWTTKPMRAHI